MTLHYAEYQPHASGFGWATCNKNLRNALAQLCELSDDGADVVFLPLVDHDFNPVSPARGKVNLAYTFFEFPLGPNAATNAAKYDIVFAGSTWCLDRMPEAGITNGKLLIQGIDRNVFINVGSRKPDWQFRIFSGGKFEYRKGQDLVIAAFKRFSRAHSDAHLVCSWFNPWPQLIQSTQKSPYMRWAAVPEGYPQESLYNGFLCINEIPEDQFTILPQLSQQDLAHEMQNTDVGLFPNRSEGGTNLVLMEYASCGRKVIANTFTGHHDIANAVTFRIRATEDANHWASQTVEDIVEQLEAAYQRRNIPEYCGMSASRWEWTWEAAAQKIVDTAHSALENCGWLRSPAESANIRHAQG